MFVDSIVGWASLVVGIVGLISSSKVPYAKIRVQLVAARNGAPGPSDDGGHIPTIQLRDTDGNDLGWYRTISSAQKMKASEYWNHDIKSIRPTELKTLDVRMEYEVSVRHARYKTSMNDGLCLAYMAWVPEDAMFNHAARAGSITGDLFYYCGYSWYDAGRDIGGTPLRCGWLDGDNSNGNSVHGMFLNTDILGSGYIKAYSKNNPNTRDICSWGVTFSGGPSPHSKRSTLASTYGNKAYVTAKGGATELCDSPTSWGPSMLSLEEGVFCDMATKTKIPMCTDDKQEDGCVNYKRRFTGKRSLSPSRTLQAKNVSSDDISFSTYDLEYFTRSDINGTVIDDGADY
ncbi:hypothetical protein BGZ72_003352 [Mortierella alpina]|nr:hypothetical protein BGZ72_003352 [Mortierella alpina]